MRKIDYNYDISKKLTQRKNLSGAKRKIRNRGINKVESRLWRILGPSFEYNGQGPKTFSGKRPDFIDENAKIIVELYGNYWHRTESLRKTIDRINLFKQHGYRTVIIWENEVDPISVRRKMALL